MFKHKEDHKVTLQQLADINNSGLNQAHKWAHSDPVVDPGESGISLKSSDSLDGGDDTERETQSMDDCLLDIATSDNNNQGGIKQSSDNIYTDCDTPEPSDSLRDEHVAEPLIHSKDELPGVQHPPIGSQMSLRREEGRKTCLVVCVVLTLFIILVILGVVIFEFVLRDTRHTSAKAIAQSLDESHQKTFNSSGLTVWSTEETNSTRVYLALLEGEYNSELAQNAFIADSPQVWTWMRGKYFQLKEEQPSAPIQFHTLGDRILQRGFLLTHVIRAGATVHAEMYEESPSVFSLVSIVTDTELRITTLDD